MKNAIFMTSYFILMLENTSMSQNFGKCDHYDVILHISYFILNTPYFILTLKDVNMI